MDIYLIRHTTPAIAKGICYGQTDLDVTANFLQRCKGLLKTVLTVCGKWALVLSLIHI